VQNKLNLLGTATPSAKSGQDA